MKIAVVSFSANLGLSEQEAIKYFCLFSKIQPTTFFLKKNSQIEDELRCPRYKKICSRVETFNFHSNWNPFFILALREKIISYNIDVLILFNMSEVKSILMATKGLNVKLILRQDLLNMKDSKNWLDAQVIDKIDAFVPASQYLAANVQSSLSNFKNVQNPTMIYSYLDCDEISIKESFQKKNKFIKQNNSQLEILHVGEIHPDRGQFEALVAASHLKFKGIPFKLTFVGEVRDDVYYQFLQIYVTDHDLSTDVYFAGQHKDAKQFYQKAHLLLCPSHGDGQTNLYVDALSHGLPILAFENSVFLELRLLGFHVHLANDQVCLNNKLEDMVSSIKDILRFSMEGNLTLVQEYFSSEIVTRQWIKLIKSLDKSLVA